MAANRHIPKLSDRAYDVLKKSQSDYLKANGFFSTDLLNKNNHPSITSAFNI